MRGNTLASRTMNLIFVNLIACIELASNWFKNNQLLSERTHAHYREPVPLRNTRQSHSLDWGLRCWIPVFFSGTWILDPFLVGFRSTWALFWIPKPWIPDTTSKIFPDFGFYKQEFPDSRIRIPLYRAKCLSNIFGPVHSYLIKQWEIYFPSNVRFYNVMNRSNFWSMQLCRLEHTLNLKRLGSETIFFCGHTEINLTRMFGAVAN